MESKFALNFNVSSAPPRANGFSAIHAHSKAGQLRQLLLPVPGRIRLGWTRRSRTLAGTWPVWTINSWVSLSRISADQAERRARDKRRYPWVGVSLEQNGWAAGESSTPQPLHLHCTSALLLYGREHCYTPVQRGASTPVGSACRRRHHLR